MPRSSANDDFSVYSSHGLIVDSKQKVENLLDDLVKILDAELEQYHSLLDMLHAQYKHFATEDIGSFEEIGKQQGTVILKIKTLEEARKSIVSQLAEYFNVPQEGFTLAKLAELVDIPYSELYIAFREEILSIIRDLENHKESNAYPIQHALHYVSGVLRIFASPSAQNYKYSSSEQIKSKHKKSISQDGINIGLEDSKRGITIR